VASWTNFGNRTFVTNIGQGSRLYSLSSTWR